MFADLHLHTDASDGSWSPAELIDQVRNTKITTIAITDHDTIDGVKPGMEAAVAFGINVIPGIEINTEYQNVDVHILGYWIDIYNQQLITSLANQRAKRIRRAEDIVKRLNQLDLKIDFQEVAKIADQGVMGRAHIARVLMEKGYVTSINDAFIQFLGRDKPAYIPYERMTPATAIQLIKQAGGVPVLAHPGLMGNDDLIHKLLEFGLVGLEAVYPNHTDEQTNNYLKLCQELQIYPTGGSDCHGWQDKHRAILGSISIPEQWVYQLQEKALNTRSKPRFYQQG